VGLFPDIPDNIFLQELDDKCDPVEPDAVTHEADDCTPKAYDEYPVTQQVGARNDIFLVQKLRRVYVRNPESSGWPTEV
jgi:hypothetical protein